ncbi:hypothetical protein P280DRAFT_479410 [Massarina eburnea CBS 473.64]|uniref:Uncharacterized protein n=1 Tax=Massarina eburnea CBS 473.64 TaxID=1395130 RepID=A0A6A6S637_9PLEO|nr:hypothetical protein P280DRAFT_479410 [Massarina eburnea CBS 473.64]
MAPLEPDATARSNILPISLFAGQVLLVVGLTTKVLVTARRAAKSLPPPATTRAQEPFRRRHAIVFSVLALLSLASVTVFAVTWRALSYLEWADLREYETPNSLWTGWYGTGETGLGSWYLGDWLSDKNLIVESDAVAVAKPEAFLYTTEHFAALLANSIFMGVEGHRRNISTLTIASFVVLGAVGSLAYSLSLFFVTILYTPVSIHRSESRRQDALFTPKPAVFYVPVLLSILGINALPRLLKQNEDVDFLRFGYIAIPLFLAFASDIIPASWGQHHASRASAHHSFAKAFYVLSLASFALHWKTFFFAFFVNTPQEHSAVYDFVVSLGNRSNSKPNRLLTGLSITATNLKRISTNPAMSVTTSDVLFTTISLLAWTFTRDLDVTTILDNSILSFLTSTKSEKHVSFDPKPRPPVDPLAEFLTPRRRGRPRKSTLTNGTSSSTPPSGGLRRSARRKTRTDFESDAESTYEPSSAEKHAIAQTETDGTPTEDPVGGGEATALAIMLAFVGGLGQMAASVLGAEVTGTNG